MVFDLASLEEVGSELGHRLRARRLTLAIQQVELAERAGVSLGTVRNLEAKGLCSLASFLRVVRALGMLEELSGLFLPKSTSLSDLKRQDSGRVRVRRPRT